MKLLVQYYELADSPQPLEVIIKKISISGAATSTFYIKSLKEGTVKAYLKKLRDFVQPLKNSFKPPQDH